MTAPTTSWVIDCGHWHCVDRNEQRHGHDVAPEACPECADERKPSERASELESRALRIGARKHQNLIDDTNEERHMASQHPDLAAAVPEEEKPA